ncbi:helix-turn-helix domain-containing protein, partial [Paenibacillus chitinolyticus]|nr:helix-turn-helix domain-containing protein [Paenibacillus chitinolyticus]
TKKKNQEEEPRRRTKKKNQEEPIKEERKDKLSYLSIPSENANDNNIHLPQVVKEDVEHKSFNWGEEWEKDFGDADRERRRKSERPLTAKGGY